MANLFKALKPIANLGHSSFDLSAKHVFSNKAGQALPIPVLDCVPDDHVSINVMSLHRSMTMNTAAFLRGKFRYDLFFVPYSQIWHPFNQFISSRDDKHSSLQYYHNFCPSIDLGKLLGLAVTYRVLHETLLPANTSHPLLDDLYGVPFHENVVRLLDLLGYGNYSPILSLGATLDGGDAYDYANQFNGKLVNLFRIAAYNHIWYDYYRNKYYDLSVHVHTEDRDYDFEYVKTFNFDDLRCDDVSNSQLVFLGAGDIRVFKAILNDETTFRIFQMFNLNYVQWKKDVFTSSMPGTQFGVVSSISLSSTVTGTDNGSWHISQNQSERGSISRLDNGLLMSSGIPETGTIEHTHSLSSNGFDVLALKRAEALQAWKQNTLRAGNMVDSQFRAHFGVKPRYEGDENVLFLGSFEALLDINSVSATADSVAGVNGKVGDLAANGVASLKGQTINFDCNDFGTILCISSFVPESEYNATMIDKQNRLLEQFDFFTPEYQNIGLEPVQGVDYDANMFSNNPNQIIGYAPRYWMYKASFDKVHGQFAKVRYQRLNNFLGLIDGSLIPWVSPRNEGFIGDGFDDAGYVKFVRSLRSFYVDPRVLDQIFGLESDGTQETDSFLNNVYFDVKAVRPMSVLGLPQF